MTLTRAHRILISVVIAGAAVIAAIGFAGSYTAVRELAEKKGFGDFAYFFPIGIDAGIVVLLALDLLLTWLRIPFPLLRQAAWLLTVATVAFNAAAAWPDMLGVGMHAVIPLLFVVTVEAARHAVGRIADITADKHMEGVRITRWLLAPLPTFLLWRRMKLWELRSYDAVIKLEQERLVYQARLRSRFGRSWRRKAPVESLMPLRLARYGVPLVETAPAGLSAAGIEVPPEALTDPAPAELASANDHQHSPDAGEDATEPAGRRDGETSQASAGASARETPERAAGAADDVVDPKPKPEPEQWQVAGTGQPTYSSVAEHESAEPASALAAPLPEPVATASAITGQGTHHPVPSAIAPGATGQTEAAAARPPSIPPARMPDTTGQPDLWETTAQDTGEATARQPQPQQQELDPEAQRIELVVQWLIEAEAVGKRLSGAEAARRLGVAARTGQRAVSAAKEVKAARERQHGRSHLRSVTHRT
ncbi:DUF2637 domain-containing protein [Streptomyces decoyicus]|uniref:DUF2637 domain-containing protein n=1 Tax=Streptomyces decoyicus TaxID=249567 RepID=UPI0033CE4BAB